MQIDLGDKNRLFIRDDGRLDFEGNASKAAEVFIRDHVLPAVNAAMGVPEEPAQPEAQDAPDEPETKDADQDDDEDA